MPAHARRTADGAEPVSWAGTGRIAGPGDVKRALAAVNAAGQGRARTTAMAQPVQRASDVALDTPDLARLLPVLPEVSELLPWPGIRRGATVAAVGSTALVFALIAEAIAQGSWAAVVGMPALNPLAAVEYGIDLEHLALVHEPGPDWPTVVGILLDGIDVVVVRPPAAPSDAVARGLMARARKRGAVLIPVGDWPGCDLRIELVERRWLGLGHARGRLRRQDVTLRATGRGGAARPRQVDTSLPPPSCAGRGLRTAPAFVRESPVERWLTLLDEQEARDGRETRSGEPRPMGGHNPQRSIAAADQELPYPINARSHAGQRQDQSKNYKSVI